MGPPHGNLCLSGTAEIPLAGGWSLVCSSVVCSFVYCLFIGMFTDRIIPMNQFPIRLDSSMVYKHHGLRVGLFKLLFFPPDWWLLVDATELKLVSGSFSYPYDMKHVRFFSPCSSGIQEELAML